MLWVVPQLPDEGLVDDIAERGIVGLVVGEVESEVGIGEMVLAVGLLYELHQVSQVVLIEEIVLVYFFQSHFRGNVVLNMVI